MGVFFQCAGSIRRRTLFVVRMLLHTAEGFSSNTDAGKLQAPKNNANNHKGKAGDDPPKTMPVLTADI